MFYFYKSYRIRPILLTLLILGITACKKDSDEAETSPTVLTFVDRTIPTTTLSNQGGMVNIQIEWAYTQWSLKIDNPIEGNSFISSVTPTSGGADNQSKSQTNIKVDFSANTTSLKNSQKIILLSPDGNAGDTIVLTQAAATVVEPTTMTISINPNTTFQTIAGFGGANKIWGNQFLNATEIKKICGIDDTDLGLSIMRVRVSSTQSEWSSMVTSLKEAQKYNVKIIATPWSPPADLKNNNSTIDGELLAANYAAYAQYLNSFVEYMTSQGISIYAVSVQNEPDYEVTYESCRWSPDQLLSFVKNNARTIQNTKIAASESFNFNQTYTNQLLSDANAVNNFDIVAGHIYGNGLAYNSLATQNNKEVWMTEYLMNMNNNWVQSTDKIWDESLSMLQSVHSAMAFNWNAYIWWYIKRYYSFMGDGEQGSTDGAILKRGYAFSHFAKFVRPGYIRVDAKSDKTSDLKITAYSGNNQIILVVINPSTSAISSANIAIPGGTITSASAYTTSSSLNRQKTTLTINESKIIHSFAAKSVTTFVLQ